MTTIVPTVPPIADPMRQRLATYFTALVAEGEEGLLAIKGVDSRASVADLISSAAMRSAEYYMFLRALLPDPTVLPAGPEGVTKSVLLAPLEISELAAHHDKVAATCERQDDHDSAQKRRDRADQLRALFSGAAL